jgi:YD repeat-containing protein
LWSGAEYRLIATDGTIYELSTARGVEAQILANGTRLTYSDSGITSSTGETIRFVQDAAGRLTQIVAPNGETVVYSYDDRGDLISVRQLVTGQSDRYGYTDHALTIASSLTQPGEVIAYGASGVSIQPIVADLGSAYRFVNQEMTGTLQAGGSDRFTLTLRESELDSVKTGQVLVAVEVTANGGLVLPKMAGLMPLVSRVEGETAYALYAVSREGLQVLEVASTHGMAGAYSLRLAVVGDLNQDGLIDGLDSGLLFEQ